MVPICIIMVVLLLYLFLFFYSQNIIFVLLDFLVCLMLCAAKFGYIMVYPVIVKNTLSLIFK